MIDPADRGEVGVAGRVRQPLALAVERARLGVGAAIGRQHAQVMEGDGAAAGVAQRLEGREGAPVV